MKTSTIVIIVLLILALIFFGYTMINQGNPGTGNLVSNYPSASYLGSGCGR